MKKILSTGIILIFFVGIIFTSGCTNRATGDIVKNNEGQSVAQQLVQQATSLKSKSIDKPASEVFIEFSGLTNIQQDELSSKYEGKYIYGCGYVYTASDKIFSDDVHVSLKRTNSFQSAMDWNIIPDYSVYFNAKEKDKLLKYNQDEPLCFLGTFQRYVRPLGHLMIDGATVITEDHARAYDSFMNSEGIDMIYKYLLAIIPFKEGKEKENLEILAEMLKENE